MTRDAASALPTLSADARTILESMGDAFYALDAAWRFIYANHHALNFWRATAGDVVGRRVWDRFPQLVGTLNEEMLRRARAEQHTLSFEAPSPVTGIWVQVTVCPWGNGVAVYWRDITERRAAEQALRAGEEHLRLAQQAAGLGTWEWDLLSGDVHLSPQTLQLLDWPPDQPHDGNYHQLWTRVVHPDDRGTVEQALVRHGDATAPFLLEFRIIRRDGEIRWIQTRGSVVANGERSSPRMFGIVMDITVRKRMEEALEQRVQERTIALRETVAELQQSRARYSAIFEYTPVDLVFIRVEPDGRLICEDANPSHLKHTGFRREDLIGHDIREYLSPEQYTYAQRMYERAISTGEIVEYEYTTKFPAGDVTRRSFLVPLRDSTNQVDHVLLTSIDLTQMRLVEAQLRQAQKMEAIGQLTGGIAHDFNNLLAAVLGNLELLQRRVTDEGAAKYVASATRAARRGGELTQQLLAYSRRQSFAPRPVDVRAVMHGMLDLLQRTLGGLVQVEMWAADDLWPAMADSTQLELMVLNLAINARDAMPQGGRLSITARDIPGGDKALPLDIAGRDFVVIVVQDTGHGMPPEVQEHAFEPFFTTKEVGKGSGLGLAQVYGLARQFGGTVRITSGVGAGTTVEIFLPRAETMPIADRPMVRARATPPAGCGDVLVVDDEADVRELAVQFLENAGYRVSAAAGAEQALAILTQKPIALALVDYAMPGMPGSELVRLARERCPSLRVVYISGNPAALGPSLLEGPDPILAKPYRSEKLLEIVAEVMMAGNVAQQ